MVHRCGDMLINPAPAAGGRDPSSQPPEHAATISAADTVNTAGPAARRTAAPAAPIPRARLDPPHRLRGPLHKPGARVPPRHQPPPAIRAAQLSDTSMRSTRTESGFTLSNDEPPGTFGRPFPPAGQRTREGSSAFKINRSLFSRPHPDAASRSDCAATDALTDSDRKPLRGHHPK
jgi:hypothetical protein